MPSCRKKISHNRKKIPCIFARPRYIEIMKERKSLNEKPLTCLFVGVTLALVSAGVAIYGLRFGFASIAFLLVAAAILNIAAWFFATPVVSFVGDFVGKFFTGSQNFSKPQPAYSLPDGLAATGQNACAILAYNELAKNHPEEILPHLRVMRIWIEKMNDVDAAVMAYNLALKKIRGQKNRNEFTKMAKNNFSKFISFE
jgi:hypothetical protein